MGRTLPGQYSLLIAILFAIFFKEKQTAIPMSGNSVGTCGTYDTENITIGNNTIQVELADTDCKRTLGLSGRNTLANGDGMLFIFPAMDSWGFWMKDMNFALDMVWADDAGTIVGIEKNATPNTYNAKNPSQSEIFGQNYFAQYVIELPAGYTDRENVKVGNKILISGKSL